MQDTESLYRLQKPSEGLFKDRGSKFITYAYPVKTLEEIEGHINALKKQYYDARHHCYAYRLGADGKKEFAADDREPANTAGPPILASLRHHRLTDTLVVVVRYFGGTKLGVRGLIEAYRSGSDDALQDAEIKEIIPKTVFKLMYPYEKTSDINRILHRFETETIDAQYTEKCIQELAIKTPQYEGLAKKFEEEGLYIKKLKEIN